MNPLEDHPGDKRSQSDDADLARAAQRGDQDAFVEIVSRHQAMVSGVALAILNDFATGEDAAQEAFLKAWTQLAKLRDPGKLRPWLCSVARTTALDHLRKRRRTGELDEIADRTPDGRPRPDEALVGEEERQSVLRALKSLPEKYRLPLVLYYHEEHSVRAVAEALDLGENAVKKRLARGREMMRKRMSGMIDSVLGERLPGAAFTGGVALAIGALKPSSATAATLATTTTAMSASKISLTTMVAIAALSVPIGYSARVGVENRFESTGSSGVPSTVPGSGTSNQTPVADPQSPLVIEWRKLRGAYGQNSSDLADLYQVIADMPDPMKQRAFKSVLIAEWAQLDPAGGIAFFRAEGRGDWERTLFLREGLKADGEATITALMASGKGWKSLARDLLSGIAEYAPGRLAEVASKIPPADSLWNDPLRDAFAVLMRNNPKAARLAAEKITGPNRIQALGGVATAWAESDGQAAFDWAQALEDSGERFAVVRAALIGWARKEPLAALDQIKTIPPGGKTNAFASTTGAQVLKEAAKTNFEATMAWVRDHQSELSRDDIGGLSNAVDRHLAADPAAFFTRLNAQGTLAPAMDAISSSLLNSGAGYRTKILEWLESAEKNTATIELKEMVLRTLSWQEPKVAMAYINQMPPGEERAKAINNAAQNILNGGQGLNQIDGFLAEAGPEWQTPLLVNGFSSLVGQELSRPKIWADRLDLIEDGALRGNAIQQLASAWSGSDPEESLAWAENLKSASEKEEATRVSMAVWTAEEPEYAVEWLDARPSGPGRDAAINGFVSALGTEQPELALHQIERVQSPGPRFEMASRVLTEIAEGDAQHASDLLGNSNLPNTEISRLRDSLNLKK